MRRIGRSKRGTGAMKGRRALRRARIVLAVGALLGAGMLAPGLPVSFISTAANCTVTGNTVRLLTVGTCTVRASPDGNTNDNAAPNVDRSFKVLYRFDSFLQPINGTAHTQAQMSVFKAGSTVPVKFQLKNVSGTVVQSAALPLWVTPVQVGTTSGLALELLLLGT